jgi:ABC-type transport system involved in multi-copper enzyme maturation permease subunit
MRLLGPVFRYDLVRVARRQRLALWRAAYGLALLGALFVFYMSALPDAWLGGSVSEKEAAAFAGRFFGIFTAVQFAVVILITPALAANAVAEERANNTLPFLLTTHLSNHEILLGKLTTRLLQVGLLVLTGLPVLAIVQLLGGVDAALMLASFAALAFTAIDLACLGLFCGVFVRKHQNAAWRAYQVMVAYLALSLLSIWYFELPQGRTPMFFTTATTWSVPGGAVATFTGGGTLTISGASLQPAPLSMWAQLCDWINVLNPYYAHLRIEYLQGPQNVFPWQKIATVVGGPVPIPGAKSLHESLAIVLRDYALAHGGLAVLLGGLAVWRLRAVVAKQTAGVTYKKRLILRPVPHPKVGERPVLWKEVYCESKPRQRWLRLFFGRWFFYSSFVGTLFLVLTWVADFHAFVGGTMFLLRFVGTFVVGLLCLRVGMQAARSIGGERDRGTLDSLLTTQLAPAEIIRDKWWGCFLAGRWLFVWLAIHWCLAAVLFLLNPLAVVALAVETVVYAAFATSLGLFFAARCRTTRQAIAATLLIGLLGTTIVPFGLGKVLAVATGERPPALQQVYYGRFPPQATITSQEWVLGMVPPWVLVQTVVPNSDFLTNYAVRPEMENILMPAFAGLVIYAAASWALGAIAGRQFARTTRRTIRRRPPGEDKSIGLEAPAATNTSNGRLATNR